MGGDASGPVASAREVSRMVSSHMIHGRRVLLDDDASPELKAAYLAELEENHRYSEAYPIWRVQGCDVCMERYKKRGELFVCKELMFTLSR